MKSEKSVEDLNILPTNFSKKMEILVFSTI